MKNKELRKLWLFIAILAATFALFLYIYNHRQAYELNYVIDNYQVMEKYDLDKGYYDIKMTKDNNTYETILNKDYTPKRQLVKSIKEVNDSNKNCIQLNEDLIKTPICKMNNENVSYFIDASSTENYSQDYGNIKIYDLLNKTYLVWNYTGFYYINNNKTTELNLFESDTYTPYLVTSVNNSLFIVNYDNEYSFTDYYLVNPKKATFKKYALEEEIYLDSYILGTYHNSVYLVDKKNNQEYEINTYKNKVYETSGKVLNKSEWDKVEIEKLVKTKYSFISDTYFYYSLDNSNLYYNEDTIKVKIEDNVDYLAYQDENDVYYISKGVLYHYDHNNGKTTIMKYSEWNFNSENSVFVF